MIQAFRVAERVLLPVMVNLDAFYVSHALEPVRVPAQELVDAYLPPYAPEHRPRYRARRILGQRGQPGHVLPPPAGHRRGDGPRARMPRAGRPRMAARSPAAARASSSATAARRADCVIVTPGQHVRHRARRGRRAARRRARRSGLLKVRLFRPLPVQALRAALAGVRDVLVLDRNYSPGARRRAAPGTARGALRHAGRAARPRLLAGVGGVNVSPREDRRTRARGARARAARPNPVWAS